MAPRLAPPGPSLPKVAPRLAPPGPSLPKMAPLAPPGPRVSHVAPLAPPGQALAHLAHDGLSIHRSHVGAPLAAPGPGVPAMLGRAEGEGEGEEQGQQQAPHRGFYWEVPPRGALYKTFSRLYHPISGLG